MNLFSNKSFAERWEVTRKMGKVKYCLRWTLLWVLFIVLGNVITILIFQRIPEWPAICVNILAIIILFLLSLLSWSSSEREYALLKEPEASQPEQNTEEPSNTENTKLDDNEAVIPDESTNDTEQDEDTEKSSNDIEEDTTPTDSGTEDTSGSKNSAVDNSESNVGINKDMEDNGDTAD